MTLNSHTAPQGMNSGDAAFNNMRPIEGVKLKYVWELLVLSFNLSPAV
jgi:hypothetical protein